MNRNLIFDLGMHRGEDTNYYLRKGFSVIGVEANPELAAECRKRFKRCLENQKLTIVDKAISWDNGSAIFFVNEDVSEWGTISAAWTNRNSQLGTKSRKITVETTKLQTLLGKYGVPYYMKIDIEGMDFECLQALNDVWDRPRFVSIESSKISYDEVFSEMAKLWELGYRQFKVIPQADVPKQICPKPAREGIYIDHRFSFGSSGLFGEELPGRWLTVHEALNAYRTIFWRYRILGDQGTIRRIPGVGKALNVNRTSKSKKFRGAYRWARWLAGQLGLRPGHYDTHAMLGDRQVLC